MKLGDFYNCVVKFGSRLDVRGPNKKINYFPDTALLHGDPDINVKKILIGIDMEVPEIILAESIRNREGLDLVISHHPEGRAYASLYEVMSLQIDMLAKAGLAKKVAQELLEIRMREVERRVLPQNHMRSVDAARILNMPYMCMHTPADNHVSDFLTKFINRNKPDRLCDLIVLLLQMPEYRDAQSYGCAPRIILGNPNKKVGKVFMEMTGGTEGSKDVYSKLYKAGIRTLLCMHLSEEHLKKAADANLNVVIAGHISSDTLGINLLLDKIEDEAGEAFEVINCSGFRRFKRN